MQNDQRQTRSRLMALFEREGAHPRGDLGQNFLIDLNLLDYVVEQARLEPEDVVLEVGSGTGGLTAKLAERAGAVVSVEIDPRMHRQACALVGDRPHVRMLLGDVLRNKNHLSPAVLEAVGEALAAGPGRRLKLVANLPYHVATPVVSNLVAGELPWARMIVTIQKELAQRMRAAPSTSDYSALSAWLQAQCRIRILKRLPPSVFWPRPQVDSAIVRLAPWTAGRESIGDREFYHLFLRGVFQQRRKLLRGVLAGLYREHLSKGDVDGLLEAAGLGGPVRAEELDVPTLVALSRRLKARIAPGAGDAAPSVPPVADASDDGEHDEPEPSLDDAGPTASEGDVQNDAHEAT
jgi:16S rRNA (adenine1518-N6/adenine1519-N6)-dimethyltransferase